MTGFHELFSTKPILVHLSGIGFSLTHLPDDMVHVTEFCREGFECYKFGWDVPVPAILCPSHLVWMSNMKVLLVIFHPTQNRLTCLPNTDLTTLKGNAVHAWSLELSNSLQYMDSQKTLSGCIHSTWN